MKIERGKESYHNCYRSIKVTTPTAIKYNGYPTQSTEEEKRTTNGKF